MASSSSSNSQLTRKFREICSDLNLDRAAADEAYNSFQRIQINYTLEGEKLHWLACALYVACRKGMTPTVGGGLDGYVKGNCVSLTRLLRSCKLSLVEFFNKMKKWSDMANLPHGMRERLDQLERNFNVSAIIFGKFGKIFKHLFKSPILSPIKQTSNRSRKQRKLSLTSGHVFSFCWTLFVHVKANFKMISDDLVNSYHLLLACIDFCFSNVLVSENAKDLLNSEFSELPPGFSSDDFVAPEPVPCIVETLCNKYEGICVDAKGIKEHWLKPCIKRMIDKKIFRCRNPTHFLGFLDNSFFEANLKAISKEYDQYVLNFGDFDERIFLSDNAHEELGAPQTDFESYLNNRMQNVQQRIKESKSLAPQTPLSNRHYLTNRENMGSFTPVTNAVQTVSRLQSLLLDCKPEPSATLVEIFSQCVNNPNERIVERVKELGDKFLKSYCQPVDDHGFSSPSPLPPHDSAKKMLNSSITLYYKCLEKIIGRELKKWSETEKKNNLSASLAHELFHLSLFACCMEIVLFAYNSEKRFPWIVDILSDYRDFHFQPLYFYRVIELIIREEDGLSRDIVKHLNTIEEQILESKAWKTGSALWDMIKAHGSVPACQDVSLANPAHDPNAMSPAPATPRRLDGIFASPLPPNMNDRFMSPMGSTRRRLFDTDQQYIQVSIPAQISTGEVRLIHVTLQSQQASNTASDASTSKSATEPPPKINKAGSLGLFFRKVYHLAWLRLRDLCDKLNINDEDLRRKIWTCFESSIRNHTDLMRDRHLDQILMCAVYAMCKVVGRDQSFQDIMKCYRQQPQASSHIYRNVLLTNRKRRNSTSSENSRNSGSNSPNQEDKERIRSSSTLPVPHPNSQPPTPTRLAGVGSNFDFPEERGDLIMFYNQIYIPEAKQYIMKFNAEAGSPPLSPLPKLAANNISPYRRISNKHSLFISPMKANIFPPSPRRPMSYHFLRSPAKDLKAINSMMKQNSSGNEKKVIKRILQDDTNETNAVTRRHGEKPVLRSMIDNIYTERQEDGDDTEDNGDVEME